MEQQPQNRRLLRDLALVYIALAHSTDDDLGPAEVEAIAARLQSWQEHATSETALGAVRDAVAAYAGDDAEQAVSAAVANTREAVPPALRQIVLDDLFAVAMADDKFLYEESTFIEQLARAWDVRLNDRSEEDDRKWSILSQDGRTGEWTAVHDLAYLYITLAHSTDDDLSTDEVTAITEKLNEWLPDAKEVDVLNIVQEAIQVYTETPHRRAFADAVEAVRRFVPVHQRGPLLADLHYVAAADGVVLDREQALIDQLARAWETPASHV